MSNEPLASVVGAQTARVILCPLDDAGGAVADALASVCADQRGPGWAVTRVATTDLGPTAAWLGSGGQDVPASVLILAATDRAMASAKLVEEFARTTGPGLGRTRIWPAFVAGEASAIQDFDSALDELHPGVADSVLLLMSAPTWDAAADALLAWLTVKLPAPPSVLGQLADASGKTCRYVALGLADVTSADHVEQAVPDDLKPDGGQEDIQPKLSALLPDSEPGRAIRSRKTALESAVTDSDPADVLAATHGLVAAAAADVSEEIRPLLNDVLSEASGDLTQSAPVRAEIDSTALTQAASSFVVAASKSGLGRIVTRSRRAAAAQDLVTAADAFVAAVEDAWTRRAADLVDDALLRTRERCAQKRMKDLEAEASERRRDAVARALKSGDTWASANASAVQRAWGAGSPAPRRYLIGRAEIVNSVIDLTDSSNPCLRVATAAGDCRMQVLVAQYGLPLAAVT